MQVPIRYQRNFRTSSTRLYPLNIELFEILFKYHKACANILYLPLSQANTTPITNKKEKIIYSAVYATTETDQPARLIQTARS